MGINPFNQPDVEASKIATRALTDAFEQSGKLPPEEPFFEADGIKLFTDSANVEALSAAAGGNRSLGGFLGALLDPEGKEYLAILAYIEMSRAHEQPLREIRRLIVNRGKLATCLGFGPRFLHSTGQAYKGGPNSGIFLQITCDDAADLAVPGQSYTFGIVKAAQARGDFEILAERGRRALRVHLGADVAGGLEAIVAAVRQGLG
jgi:transaldolase/glucose-6-phosphate isomerase